MSEPRKEPVTENCMRNCPTMHGDSRSLITHSIAVDACLKRQRDFYHKCFRCAYRGKPAGYVPETVAELATE